VYWANNVSRTGSVMRVAKQGGAPEVVANTQGAPYGPALTGGALYWVNSEEGSVLRAALDGRDRKVLATKQAFPAAIVTDGRSVFWFHTKAGVELRKVSIDGGTPVTVATEHGNPQSLVIHGSRVYYTNPYRGAVMAVPLDGGAVEELVIDEHYPIELAVDDTSLYWIDHDRPSHDAPPPKRIRKAPLKGGDAITLASGKDAIGIAVDASCVYWTEARGTTGAVMAVAK
jgi:sugar lactone lactonase YvrE